MQQPPPGPRPFDVSSRQLIDRDPAAWLAWAGLPVNGPVRALDSEVSTVLAEVDKVLQVDADPPWLAHLELQSSYDPDLPLRVLGYHALLLGLRYDKSQIRRISQRARLMSWWRDSETYQMVLEEGLEKGREEGQREAARRFLLRIGANRLGSPSDDVIAEIDSISDVDRLEQLGVRVAAASSWDELFAGRADN